MPNSEIDDFVGLWEQESELTRNLLKTIPQGRYDVRADSQGRSLGEPDAKRPSLD